jgi:hypothetical protein
MAFNLIPLLIHSGVVPQGARDALEAATNAPPKQRDAQLESAARVLYRETDLDCVDVRELVGLEPGPCG